MHMKNALLTAIAGVGMVVLAQTGFADPADDLLRTEMASHRIPGAALKVIKDGKAVKTSVYLLQLIFTPKSLIIEQIFLTHLYSTF